MKRLRALRRWFARKFGYARVVCLALLVGFAALRIADPAAVEEIRVRTFDTFQRIDPRVKKVRPVTIIDIDEKSLAKFGQWPWPRTRIADMVANLTKLGAVVIAFDVIFSEPDRLNPDVAADTFRNLDEVTSREVAGAAEQRSGFRGCDAALARGAGRIRAYRGDGGIRQDASGDRVGDAG
jgi:adenylate cyclase